MVLSVGGDFLKTSNFRKNPMDIFSLIFTVIGLILLSVAVLISANNIKFKNNSLEISAVVGNIVVDNDSNSKKYKDTLINYDLNGTKYENISLGTYINNAEIGDTVTAYVYKDNPLNVKKEKGSFFFSAFLFILGITLFVSAFFAKKTIDKRKKEVEYLLNNGKKIKAKIIEVQLNTSLGYGSKRPVIIVSKAFDQNSINYYSDNVWGLTNFDIIGNDIDVFIDKQNSKNYYVDVRKVGDI